MDAMIIPEEMETTGRYIVTLREGARAQGLEALSNEAGLDISSVAASSDFGEGGVDMSQIAAGGGVTLDHIGVAIVDTPPDAVAALSAVDDPAILAVEPEGVQYALSDAVTLDYLRGFRDAADGILKSADMNGANGAARIAEAPGDTALLTWGLQATKAGISDLSGEGIKIAILDTGLFLAHPDFAGRPIVSQSFIPGVASADDGHGHGTHCTGTACGALRPPVGRRYGVAHKSLIHIGKVLSDQGSGADGGILAGIDWAVANRCEVISMSLGSNVPTTSIAYETAGQRALDAGSLIVAAAGNNARRHEGYFGFVGRPANSRTFMAVAAVDVRAAMAFFSGRDTMLQPGTAVDIAGPGVDVYSSWPMPARTNTISGTSMATPHVAGIAALWAQKTGARGGALWQHLIANCRTLTQPVGDVGRGLVQAP